MPGERQSTCPRSVCRDGITSFQRTPTNLIGACTCTRPGGACGIIVLVLQKKVYGKSATRVADRLSPGVRKGVERTVLGTGTAARKYACAAGKGVREIGAGRARRGWACGRCRTRICSRRGPAATECGSRWPRRSRTTWRVGQAADCSSSPVEAGWSCCSDKRRALSSS